MQRCLYINSQGQQCPVLAVDDTEFCDDHLTAPELDEPIRLAWAYRILRRLGAAALLVMVLLQLYVGMRLLLGYPTTSSPPSTPMTLPVTQ